jgi:hypothetical protein
MNQASAGIVRWLEHKRRTERAAAAVISVLALGSGAAVFLLISFLVYTILAVICGTLRHSVPGLVLAAVGLTAAFFAGNLKSRTDERELGLDPMGRWIIRDICAVGPRWPSPDSAGEAPPRNSSAGRSIGPPP